MKLVGVWDGKTTGDDRNHDGSGHMADFGDRSELGQKLLVIAERYPRRPLPINDHDIPRCLYHDYSREFLPIPIPCDWRYGEMAELLLAPCF